MRDADVGFSEITLYFPLFLLPLVGAKPDTLYCYISWSILKSR
jgi:hypothetical protein